MTGPARVEGDTQVLCDLGDELFVAVNGAGGMGQSNSAVLVDGQVATVVDTMLLPRMNQLVREELMARNAVARQVLNTHQHLDHVGGNTAFPDADLIAHPVVADILRQTAEDTSFLPKLMPRFADELHDVRLAVPRPVAAEDMALPNGAKPLVFESAHSIVDLAVWLPDRRVLLAGDLCFNGVVPLALHGSVKGWITALDELIQLRPDVVVPGHGPVTGVETLHELKRYFVAILAAAAPIAAEECSLEDAVEVFDPGELGRWLETSRSRLNLMSAAADLAGRPLAKERPR